MKLNLDGWKKLTSDAKHTTLQHGDGHQIRVMHSALSPKIRGQLAALPMADGGEVEDQDETQDLVNDIKDEDLAHSVMKESIDPRMAQGGNVDPTQQHLLPGDKDPNKIEKSVVSRARQGLAEGGGVKQPATVINIGQPQIGASNLNPNAGQQSADAQSSNPQQMSQAQQNAVEPPMGAQPDQSPQQAPPQAQSAQPSQPQASAPQDDQQDEQPSSQAAPAAESPSDQAYNQAGLGQPAIPHHEAVKQAELQDSLKEDAAFQQDLANGHITPETYGQLADKSTFGRLGTMFGLMLGGIGSGVTGQPNALLGMMDKAIDRDLNAQMTSKKNAQNLYQLTSQRVLSQAQADNTNIDTKAKTYALAKAHMNSLMLHHLVGIADGMPEGPQKEQAKQTLALLNSTIQNENYQLMDRAASASALTSMVSPPKAGDAQAQTEQQFQAQNRALELAGHGALAQERASKHIPGMLGEATQAIPQDKRDNIVSMNVLDNKMQDILDFAKAHKGSINPNILAQGGQKINEAVNFYNNSINGGQLTAGRLSWMENQLGKNPTSIFQDVLGNNAKLKEIKDSNAQRRDTLVKSLGNLSFPPGSPQASSSQAAPQTKVINGITYMRGPDGKAVRVK